MNSHELHAFYMDLHVESRAYKDAINKINVKRQSNGKTPLERRTVEMNNFQNPQVNDILYNFNLVDLYTGYYVKAVQPSPTGIIFRLVSPRPI